MQFSQNEIYRYSRHFSVPQIGIKGQTKLKNASVLLIGAGGIGAPAALYLTACGVGKIGIVDDDKIELSNLQRQILYKTEQQGQAKATIAKQHLTALNDNVEINVSMHRITRDNATSIIQNYDLIIDGSDNYPTRYAVNFACAQLKKPLISASIYTFSGQLSVFNYQNGPCYRCLYPNEPPKGLVPNCADAGVLGVVPGILGTMAANEALKIILNIGEVLSGKLLTFDALSSETKKYSFNKNPTCKCCITGQALITDKPNDKIKVPEISPQEFKTLKDKHLVVDVREAWEREICQLPGSLHLPFSTFKAEQLEFAKQDKIIVHCKLGGRSQKVVKQLKDAGFNNVHNLTGGIIAYIDKVNQKLMKY